MINLGATPSMSNRDKVKALEDLLEDQIFGQKQLTSRLIIALLANGHLLVEGAPGLAKTRAIKVLATGVEGDFQRVQFTPDLLPSDITGTEIYRPQDSSFEFKPGPVFHNLLLADEINRAPAKVQSALLEAMGEGQVSVSGETHILPDLFLVMATQNPLEQEGTYPLPEAQLDRFLMHVVIGYPNAEAEKQILRLTRDEASEIPKLSEALLKQQDIFTIRKEILQMQMVPEIEDYIVALIVATRELGELIPELDGCLEFGASPRGSIALDRCARAHAWLANRDFVTPEDVQQVCADVLRHRIGLSFEAEAKGISCDSIIDQLLKHVPAP